MINIRKPADADPSGGQAKPLMGLSDVTDLDEHSVIKSKPGFKVNNAEEIRRT